MGVIINKTIEVSDSKLNRTKYKVKRLKTISGVIHAVIADKERMELLVALSVLEDKSKFNIIKADKFKYYKIG